MTINQTIEGTLRADLESICEQFESGRHWQAMAGVKKLRALLESPAGTDWKAAHDTVLKHHRETFAEHIVEIERLKSALELGEPVAWVSPEALSHTESASKTTWPSFAPICSHQSNVDGLSLALYREQPAQLVIEDYQNKINHLKQLLCNVRATLHFSPEDVLAIDAALREDEE